jgi:hypothetical protein
VKLALVILKRKGTMMKTILLILFEISILFYSTTIFSQQSYSVEIPALETYIAVHSYYPMDIGFNALRAGENTGWIYRSYLTWNNILQSVPNNSQILYVEFIIYWQHSYDVTNVDYVEFDNSGSYYSDWENIGQGTVLASFPSTTTNYSFGWLINQVQDIVNGSVSNELHIGIKNQHEFNPNYPQYFVYWNNANVVMNITFIPPNQLVTLDQRKSNNQQVGVLRKWEGAQFTDPPFAPGSQFPFPISQQQTILGDQTIQDNEKYNNWNFDKSDVRNHHTFTITSETSELTSRFEQTYSGITIRNSLEGTTVDGGEVEFRDPWFIDYPDPVFPKPNEGYYERNRGMNDAIFYQRPSPFNPTHGSQYKGVFLNQGWPNWEPPYYSVKSSTQDITLTNTGNPAGRSHKFYFRNWSYDANKISLQTPGSNETAVVFKTSDAVLSANLKGTNLSEDPDAYNTTSQRKFIKTPDGYLHSVYSSLGRVWYEQSPDNGQSWFIITQQPLDDGPDKQAKLPSIDYGYYDNPEGNDFYWTVIVYQEKSGSGFKIKAKSFQRTQIGEYYLYQDVKELVTYSSVSYSTDANPVLAIDVSGLITFVWEQKSGDAGLYRSNSKVNIYGLETPSTPSKISGTNYWSTNPSVTVTKSWFSGTTRHLVWQAPGVVNSTDIIYKTFEYSGSQSGTTNISNGNGYPVNYSPCISLANGKPVVSWTGYFDGNMYKVTSQQDEMLRIRAFVKVKSEDGWGSFTELGDNVNYVNNNSVTSASEKTVIVWSQGTTPQSKWVRRSGGAYATIYNLSHSGIENQVTTGTDFNNMTAMVFNKQTLPFYFIKSTTNFSAEYPGGGINKITLSDSVITYGRSGIVSKQGVEFVFNTGDVFVADSLVQFTFIPDTLMFNSAEELNSVARTENFWLEEGVDFFFSNLYYVIRQELADSVLTEQDQVNFKVELVKVQSGDVVGTFDNITYNKNNLEKYASIHYLVNTSGIQAGEYYLRLVTTVAGDAAYNLSNIQRNEFDLNKLNYVNVSFKGETMPVTYELSQNYPNPFNPTTTIRYQLPKDGMVTLKVYDILGAEVATLVNEEKIVGRYEVSFDASRLASGVYIYRLQANDYIAVKKMVLLK